VEPDAYIVGPGDVFSLVMSGRVSRTQVLRVSPEGSVLIQGWPPIRVAGLTLRQARTDVLRVLERDLRGVDIDLELARVRFIRVTLAGDVRSLEPIVVPATSRVSDVVQDTLLRRGASRRAIEVRRRDGTAESADLVLFMRTGRMDRNPFLRDGDVIHVPAATRFVEIHGALARPSQFELGAGDSLSTLIELAGGLLPSAQAERALLVRWRDPHRTDSVWFRPDSVLAGVSDLALANGDRVYVGFIPAFHELEQVVALGEFERPGTYPIVSGRTRLSELVRSAGGFRDRADLRSIRVTRAPANIGDWRDDPEYTRLSRLSRGEMTSGEYERLRTNLAARRREYRVTWQDLVRQPELDLVLSSGDSIRVDPVLPSIRVDGEVLRPGVVDFATGRRATDYITMAGGFARRAAKGRVLVTRSVSGQTLRASDAGPLDPGDLVWVPERPDRTLLEQALPILSLAASVATIVIAVRR
jgi:protein involved in polysaccharide export with SLBB domain